MSQGNDFANYSEAPNAESGGSEEVWFVAVSSDDIKQMTVDQLDEAFRLGIINGETAVWTEGMEAWAPLGQVADLDGEGGGSEDSGAGEGEQRLPEQRLPEQRTAEPPRVGAGFGEVTLQSVQRGQHLGPSSVAPVTSSYAPSAGLGQSAGPVPFNVDEEIPPLRQSRRFRPERWALGAAAAIAIGAAAFYSLDSSSVASARTDAPAALAARPHEDTARAEPARGEPLGASSEQGGSAPREGAAAALEDGPSALAGAATAAAGAAAAKAATSGKLDDAEDAPPSGKAASSEKDSLKGDFSKAISKKSASKSKAKPRKARRTGTKSRAAKSRAARSRAAKPRASKKPSVPRSQSAFDPLNDSLP